MSDKPKRIQLRRTKGWKKPEGAVVVRRPTKWGNPFKIGEDVSYHFAPGWGGFEDFSCLTAEQAVHCYREWLSLGLIPLSDTAQIGKPGDVSELRGKNLCCTCALDQPCHADVLLELANAP